MEKGYTLYFTGLSGSGKSTLANKTVNYLKSKNKKVQLIDGDVMRSSIGNMFGYTREERLKAANVVRLLCRLLNDNGIITVVAVIGAYEELRDKNKEQISNYYEVFVDCSLEECIRRDVKGLYKRALSGQEKYVIGIDEPYEKPKKPSVIVNTEELTIEQSMEIIKKLVNQIDYK